MALTLVSVEDGYIVHEDVDGDETLSTPGPVFVTLTLWEDFDLSEAWADAVTAHREKSTAWWATRPDHAAFIADVHRVIADVESVSIVWCKDCDEPTDGEDAEQVGDGYACSSCYEDYMGCADCGNQVPSDDTHYTLHVESVCSRCCDNNYLYCEDCDGYYHHNYSDEHGHNEDGCDCESPAQVFTMRNDGEPALNQDERVTISLPAGMISQEGIWQIQQLVRKVYYNLNNTVSDTPITDAAEREKVYTEASKWHQLSYDLVDALGAEWQTREGNYTKRLSKLAHKLHGLKISPEMLSQIGCIGRDNSTGSDFQIEVTRDLNQSAEDFYHEDSCWWQSYYEGRCSLKNNGGIGLRTFGGPYNSVQGRAWIMPLRLDENGDLQATFDSLTADAFVVFNGYGDLSGYVPARIVAHMAGMTYRKLGFDCSPMYVNGNSGYLVASEEIATKYAERKRLSLDADTHSNLYHNERNRELAAV